MVDQGQMMNHHKSSQSRSRNTNGRSRATKKHIKKHLAATLLRNTWKSSYELSLFWESFWPLKPRVLHTVPRVYTDNVTPDFFPVTGQLHVKPCSDESHCQVFQKWMTNINFIGAGVLRKFGADFFFLCFFFASIFQTNGMLKPVFCADFWCADFCAHFCALFWCADFCAHFCADLWCADFCAHFCAHFPQIFLRRFGAWKIGVPESRKNAQKMRGKIRGVRMALLGGAPHSLSAFSSRQHVTKPPLGRHTQGEHVSVHRDIFGLKCMLAFAPRFFKNENPRKMSSAKPQPQNFRLFIADLRNLETEFTVWWQFESRSNRCDFHSHHSNRMMATRSMNQITPFDRKRFQVVRITESEPCLSTSTKSTEVPRNPFSKGTVGTENQNCSNCSMHEP